MRSRARTCPARSAEAGRQHTRQAELVPAAWEPVQAGHQVMERLIRVTPPRVKGAHDAEFVCVGDRAYIVAEVNDLKGGEMPAWPFIYRNDAGNYHFTTSGDGRAWTVAKEMPHVPNGANSKPTFDCFGGVYYLGWQEATRVQGVSRSVFNVDISRDSKTWARKYRFETPKSFQYPTFHEHEARSGSRSRRATRTRAARSASCSASWKTCRQHQEDR